MQILGDFIFFNASILSYVKRKYLPSKIMCRVIYIKFQQKSRNETFFHTHTLLPSGLVDKNRPAMQETWVQYLSQEDALEMEMAIHSTILVENTMDRGAWWAAVRWVAKELDMTEPTCLLHTHTHTHTHTHWHTLDILWIWFQTTAIKKIPQ